MFVFVFVLDHHWPFGGIVSVDSLPALLELRVAYISQSSEPRLTIGRAADVGEYLFKQLKLIFV